MGKIKVAVIGYGHLGKWHCQKVETSGLAQLDYIVEPNPQNAQLAQDAFSGVKVVSELEQCLDNIDAAIVVTPTKYHAEVITKLLASQKHIFCEKPVTSSVTEVEQFLSLLNEQLIFQVGHSERFHTLWQAKKRYLPFLVEGHIEINRYAPFKGRATDVDVVQDLMIHDIDLLYWLTGNYPQQVTSRAFKIRTDKWDSVVANFILPQSISATVNVGRNHCYERRDITITNHLGTCYIDLMQERVLFAYADREETEELKFSAQDHLQIEHNYFYQSIKEKTPIVVTLEEGKRAVQIVEGVLASIKAWPNYYQL